MSVDISVSITEDVVDIIATPTVNIVNVTNSASINPGLYDLSQFTNTSVNPFVRTSGLSSYVPTTRTISTTSPLTGGGDLSANRTLSIPMATTLVDGYLSAADWTIFNGKQNALGFTPVPTTRTLTINGTTQDLSADRTFTVSTGITIGTTAITSGTVGRVLFEGTGNVVQESANLFWDNTNGRLGIGTNAPSGRIHVKNSIASEIFKAESTIAALYAQFVSTDGAGEFGIYTDAFYFQPLPSLANGTRFLNGANTVIMQLAQTGNVLINTTTDAGFKLDVNGTARVKGTGTGSGTSAFTIINSGNTENFRVADDGVTFIRSGTALRTGTAGSDYYLDLGNIVVRNGNGTAASTMSIGKSTVSVASSIFELVSTTKGFLPPRMDTTQKNAIASPASGLVIFDVTLNKLCVFTTVWETVTSL